MTRLIPSRSTPVSPSVASFSDQLYPIDVFPGPLSISGFSWENIMALMTGHFPISVSTGSFHLLTRQQRRVLNQLNARNCRAPTTCWELGLQIIGIGFLSFLGQYSQIWGLGDCEKMVTHSTCLGSSFEKPRMQHSLLSPEVTYVPM